MANVEQMQELTFKLGIDPGDIVDEGQNSYEAAAYDNFIRVYIDRDFTVKAAYNTEFDPDSMQLTISPTTGVRSPLSASKQWGHAHQYFIVQYYDAETGAKLDKPLVTIFTVKAALESPKVEFIRNEDGTARLAWNAIEDAHEYWVYVTHGEGSQSEGMRINSTDDATKPEYLFDGDELTMRGTDITFMNTFFYDPKEGKEIIVFAVNGNGEFSAAGNPIRVDSINRFLPYFTAPEHGNSRAVVTNIHELDPYTFIQMCDTSVTMYPVTFDIEHAEIMDVQERFNLDKETIVLYIPGRVDGTLITAPYYVREWDDETLIEELIELVIRTENAKLSGAGLISSPTLEIGNPNDIITADTNITLLPEMPAIYASSALSEYLAINMLSNTVNIDIGEFFEAYNVDALLDAFFEALYQNPLILGVSGLETVPGTTILRVHYEQDQEELFRKQEEIIAEVARIVNEVITPDMTDLEKQIALNNYLCETSVYDYDALEVAMANDMILPDNSFRDSFTPYGVLINKVGVCASYAAAFHLLAEAAGLESIVVTGYLSGYLPHAWNRTNIDGEWLTLDVTNNGNPGLINMLLNLPDDAAATMLVEDDRYILDRRLGEFTASTGDIEYYRLTGKYFDRDEIAKELAAEFTANGRVSLRTDYNLSESELWAIVEEMLEYIDDYDVLMLLMESYFINSWGVIYIGDEAGLMLE
jgi:transglutaminase-like putative cysteine protease